MKVKKLGYLVSDNDDSFYITDTNKINRLPAGCYTIELDPSNAMFLKTFDVKVNGYVDFPSSKLQDLILETSNFRHQPDKYKKYNLFHKRGFLLYGEPGVGKTVTVLKLCEHIISDDGLIFFCEYFNDNIRRQLIKIREAEPKRFITVVFDQFDAILFEDGYINTELLDFLDGIRGIDHVLFIAMTNNLQIITDSVKNRPSRFDLKLEMAEPTDSDREFYFKQMIPADELHQIDLKQWVKDTDGFTISHLKELITSFFIYGTSYKKSISGIRKINTNSKKELGFKTKNSEPE
jgi:AAA+ superfamily predicted ATPase